MSESEVCIYRELGKERLAEILAAIAKIKIGVIGDICLDIYWLADMTQSELSRETPHFPLPVIEERISPGAGGNVAANAAALQPAKVFVLSVLGRDWRGDMLLRELRQRSIDTRGVIVSQARTTNAYCKPMRRGISDLLYEDPRIDFDNFTPLPEEDEQKLLQMLDETVPDIDVLCVSDQYQFGCISGGVRERIRSLARQGLKVVADSRHRIGDYSDMYLKPNEVEAYQAVQMEGDPRRASFAEQIRMARQLAVRNRAKVCMTLGEKGCLYTDHGKLIHIPTCKSEPPLDICGAGDTFLAAFAAALASGAREWEAAAVGNFASAVTIKKINNTGTASRDEILEKHAACAS